MLKLCQVKIKKKLAKKYDGQFIFSVILFRVNVSINPTSGTEVYDSEMLNFLIKTIKNGIFVITEGDKKIKGYDQEPTILTSRS